MQLTVSLGCLSCIPPAAMAQPQDEPRLQSFDHIVTTKLIRSGLKRDINLTRIVSLKKETRDYAYSYNFKPRKRTEYYICSVSVGRAGVFINQDSFKHDYATTAAEYSDRGEEYLLFHYPKIGLRAKREPIIAGPNGSFSGLAFTTSDGDFDVKVSVGCLLPDSIPDPGFDVEGVARKISDLYDTARK